MLTIYLDHASPAPVYRQIADQVRRGIALGELEPGTRLPSLRQLAADLAVNLNTVARAYRQLEQEGFVAIAGRSGVQTLGPGEVRSDLVENARFEAEIETLLSCWRQTGLAPDAIASRLAGICSRLFSAEKD